MKQVIPLIAFFLIILLFFAGCKKEYSCENACNISNQAPAPGFLNKPPVARAGSDTSILLPGEILLNGSTSFDPDNNINLYKWTKIAGPLLFSIVNQDAVKTMVTGLVKGIYLFELKVTDSTGLFSKDTIQVTVNDLSCDVSMRPFTNARLTPIGTFSRKRENIAIAAAGNKILFAGGIIAGVVSATVDIYDIVNQTWSVAALSVPRHDMAVAIAGNKIFFGGGYNGNDLKPATYATVDMYDVASNTWSVTQMGTSAGGRSAAVVNNKVFFAGGYHSNGMPGGVDLPATTDIYDVQTGAWSAAVLSAGRLSISAVAANNNVYFAGGLTAGNTGTAVIDIYNGGTGKWSRRSLLEPAGNMAGIAVGDKIYWAGGHTEPPGRSLNRVEIMDTKTNSIATDCLFQRNEVFAAVMKNNRLVFFTGNSALTGAKNKFDIYDIGSNSWSIGLLFDGIQGASVISVNNTIYVAGGYVLGSLTNQLWKLEF
ncbi:MAG: kelch repeat-containing protein [Chitinophagaceae bacterium]